GAFGCSAPWHRAPIGCAGIAGRVDCAHFRQLQYRAVHRPWTWRGGVELDRRRGGLCRGGLAPCGPGLGAGGGGAGGGGGGRGRSLFKDVLDGVNYAAGHPAIGKLLLIFAAACLLVRPAYELMPGIVGALFEGGVGGLSSMITAIGIGAVIAALNLARSADLE